MNEGINKGIRDTQLIVLNSLILLLSIFYCYLATLPKHGDFWSLNYIAKIFAIGNYDIYEGFAAVAGQSIVNAMHPPAFYVLQGLWIKLGEQLFKFNLTNWDNPYDPTTYPPFFLWWGMITYLLALFALVIASYHTLKNKWICLICYGTFSFISIIIMGQTDVFCALLIYLSLFFALKSFDTNKYMFYSTVLLGVSIAFKTYGAMLFPVYILYFLLILKIKKMSYTHVYGTLVLLMLAFILSAIIIWVPYARWFSDVMMGGESNWLFNLQIVPIALPPYHIVSIWLLGYLVILYDLLHNIIKNPYMLYTKNKFFIYYIFAIVSWFFISVYNHPQWWMLIVPPILLVLDNFNNKLNYLFLVLIQFLFLFYSMMWVNNIDTILRYYIPVIMISGNFATLLSTLIISILIIWIIELKRELGNNPVRNEERFLISELELVTPVAVFFILLISAMFIIIGINHIGVSQEVADTPIGEIYGDISVGQTFLSPYDNLNSIEVLFATYARTNNKDIIFHLRELTSSKDIIAIKVNAKEIKDNSYHRFSFPKLNNSKNKSYYFFVNSPQSVNGNAITIWSNMANPYKDGSAYKNGQPINDCDLSFRVYYE